MQDCKEIKSSKLIVIEAICLLSIPLFFVAVWMPVYQMVSSDITMQDSFFLLIWDFIREGLIYLFFWFSIAFLAVSLFYYGWKGSLPFFGFYFSGSVIRSVGTAVSSAIILSSFGEEFGENVSFAFIDVLLDLFLLAVYCLIFYLAAMRGRNAEARKDFLPPAPKGFQPVPLHLAVL